MNYLEKKYLEYLEYLDFFINFAADFKKNQRLDN